MLCPVFVFLRVEIQSMSNGEIRIKKRFNSQHSILQKDSFLSEFNSRSANQRYSFLFKAVFESVQFSIIQNPSGYQSNSQSKILSERINRLSCAFLSLSIFQSAKDSHNSSNSTLRLDSIQN